MYTQKLMFYSSSLSSLFITIFGGMAYRTIPQTLRDKYEKKGFKVVKDGTELLYLKKNVEDNKDIAGDVIPSIVASIVADESLKINNALALKTWCRGQLFKSPYFVGRAEELLIRRFCTFNDSQSSAKT